MPIMATAPARGPSVPSVKPANSGREVPWAAPSELIGVSPLSVLDTSQTVVGSTRTPTCKPVPSWPMSADVAMAIGLASIVPDPFTDTHEEEMPPGGIQGGVVVGVEVVGPGILLRS